MNEERTGSLRGRLLLLLFSLISALAIDLLTKVMAERILFTNAPMEVLGQWLRLTLVYNEGIAFGFLATDGLGVVILTGAATLLVGLWVIRVLRTNGAIPAPWALGLLLGGAFGNLADRVADGRVTDFLDVGLGAHRWPTFNFADVFIMVGIALIFAWSHRSNSEPERPTQRPSNPGPVAGRISSGAPESGAELTVDHQHVEPAEHGL